MLRRGSVCLAVLGLLAGVLVPAGLAAPAASPRGSVTAYLQPVNVVTSTGRHLRLWLQAETESLDVMLGRGRFPGAEEVHDWMFTPPRQDFHYDRSTGRGHITTTPEQTAGFAQLQLEFHRVGAWKAESCTSGSASDARIEFEGTIGFRSRTPGGRRPWGRVGSFVHPLRITAHGQLRAFNNCVATPDGKCSAGYTWQHGRFLTQPLETTSGTVPMLEGSRWHQRVGKHASVQRLDDVFVPASAPRLRVRSDGSAVLHVTTDSAPAHGSARLIADKAATVTRSSCGTTRDWQVSRWRNGARPLTIRVDVGADMFAPDGPGGFFRRTVRS